jgi:asparagine synthase (glutamine-hydrolysing)
MCGFAAQYSESGGVNREDLAKAVAMLHHRGPDASATWLSQDGRVGLGHTRLSIIDLVTGDQPLANEDDTVHVVVNGELYAYEEIRRDLEAAGHRFKTRSDSEIVLHLYEAYGAQCLHRLRGEFAFVLWDSRNHTLLAGRDRFGIKPLFFAEHAGTLHFASEAKALFAAGVPARWDEASVYLSHAGRLLPPGRSLFRGVEQVPPGHYLLVTPGRRQLLKYWDFDYPVAGSERIIKDPREALAAVSAKFTEAVRLRLRADVPVGCYLSGGLDSCSILGTACRLAERPISAFTLTFEAGDYDESVIAEEMAAFAGAPYHPLAIRTRDIADHFADAVWHGEVPLINGHAVAKFLLSRFVRDAGYKVVLTGEGSDEIFGGYAHFKKDWLLYNSGITDPAVRARLLADMERTNVVSRPMLNDQGAGALPQVEALMGFVPTFLRSGVGISSDRGANLLAPEFRERFAGWDGFQAFFNETDVQGQLKGREPVNQSLYLWSKTFLPNYLLTVLGDRMEMAHSVEGRVPFLDHELVELVTRIPVSEKIKAMREKHLLREAAKDVITDTVYRREKHPFLAPPAASAKDPALHEFVRDTLGGPTLANVGFYDRKAVLEMVESAAGATPDMKALLDGAMMMVTSFAVLQQRLGLS